MTDFWAAAFIIMAGVLTHIGQTCFTLALGAKNKKVDPVGYAVTAVILGTGFVLGALLLLTYAIDLIRRT